MSGPRVKLMELREYVSERTGNTYFSGYLGKARVVVLRDERAECTGKEKARWSVLLEEPEPREGDRQPGSRSKPRTPPRARRETPADRAAGQMLRERGIGPEGPMLNDEIPF